MFKVYYLQCLVFRYKNINLLTEKFLGTCPLTPSISMLCMLVVLFIITHYTKGANLYCMPHTSKITLTVHGPYSLKSGSSKSNSMLSAAAVYVN